MLPIEGVEDFDPNYEYPPLQVKDVWTMIATKEESKVLNEFQMIAKAQGMDKILQNKKMNEKLLEILMEAFVDNGSGHFTINIKSNK